MPATRLTGRVALYRGDHSGEPAAYQWGEVSVYTYSNFEVTGYGETFDLGSGERFYCPSKPGDGMSLMRGEQALPLLCAGLGWARA